MSNLARITFLGLFDEFDVKAKSSLKFRVWDYNYQPCDILGILMNRLGYIADGHGATDSRLAGILQVSLNSLQRIYLEIDRSDSTNESIRNLVKNIFEDFPILTESASY
jgi:hypothetical protein